MFPLQRGNEMVIQFSGCPHYHQHQISEDRILDGHSHASQEDMISFSDKKSHSGTGRSRTSTSRPKKLLYGSCDNQINHEISNDKHKKNKKIVHREIERQRRQEMATLYASLRSHLPLEFIKGKRSISDHMNEAVNYIKHLEKNIKELSAKRDELKKLSNNSSNPENHESESEQYTSSNSFFSVRELNDNGGVGIEVSSGFREERLRLSKLLELVLEEGLGVVTCVSSQVNGRLIHCVQCEVNNSDGVDLPALRRKISNAVPSFRCSDY